MRIKRPLSSLKLILLAALVLLQSGCEDSREPILRGVKQTIDELFDSHPEKIADDSGSVENTSESLPETEKEPLNLNIPDDILQGELPQMAHDPVWGPDVKAASAGEYQTFPNLFEDAPSEDDSTMGVSGKLHWDETEEETDESIPRLRDIKGAELEISVKTR